jgi:sialic acid synthase SpsE
MKKPYVIPKGIRFHEGVITGTDTAARFAYAKTSDGKTSYWGFDQSVTTDEQAAAQLMEECRKMNITIL